jgi:Zn-dependent protease with chaperone function
MKRTYAIVMLCLSLLVAPTARAAAQEPEGRDPAEEQEIYDQLGEIDPAAVPIFQEATQAMDMGDLMAAREGYEQVLVLAPDFPDALRRLSYVEVQLGDAESALSHAEQAYAVDPSPWNQYALAQAMLATEDPAHVADAFVHARDAAAALPDYPGVQYVLLFAALNYEDVDSLRQASEALIRLVPDQPVGYYIAGLIAADDGRWEDAERKLLLAQELGMPAEQVQEALDSGIRTQARMWRAIRWAGYALAAWLVGLILLTLTGVLLSRLTLATVRRTQSTGSFEIGRGEGLLRGFYRLVIAVTSLYFYASIPLLILVVLAVTLGVLYLMFSAGRVSLRLAAVVGLAGLYTLYAIIRSLFVRIKEPEPGRPLPKEEAPRLWSLTEEVADRLETRPVEAIYVTAGTEIAVTERGGLWQKLRGLGQRCLIVGLGALPGMTQGQLRAILAHEYGHFSHRDTAGGNLVRQVHASLHLMAYGLASSGQARWYNPAWLFVNGYNRIFLRVTLGASRLQEILADRYAAVSFGARNLIDGLKHIIRQSLIFDLKAKTEIQSAVEEGRSLQNLYALPPLKGEEQLAELEQREAEVMGRPTSPYDSHPAPKERIALLERLRTGAEVEGEDRPAWVLLPDRKALQEEMTRTVQANVDRQYPRGTGSRGEQEKAGEGE